MLSWRLKKLPGKKSRMTDDRTIPSLRLLECVVACDMPPVGTCDWRDDGRARRDASTVGHSFGQASAGCSFGVDSHDIFRALWLHNGRFLICNMYSSFSVLAYRRPATVRSPGSRLIHESRIPGKLLDETSPELYCG
jgi:hypothetical protein